MNKLKRARQLVEEILNDYAEDAYETMGEAYRHGIEVGRAELAEEILEILNGEEK